MKKSNIKIVEALRADFMNFAFYILIFAFLPAGCQKSTQSDAPLQIKIDQLTKEKARLQKDLTLSNSEKEQLKKQVQVLSGLPENVGLDRIYHLQSVKLHRYTDLLDEDKDGKMEKLVVYVQPIDDRGDIIKAAGNVSVQLWDLNQTNGEALLGQWSVDAEQIKNRWVSFLVTNYRLTFDLAEKVVRLERPLTVKVTFTDYLSGKVFNEQRVIEPNAK